MPGPTVNPGAYQLTLQVMGEEHSQSFNLIKDAASGASEEDSRKQFELLMSIYQLYSDATEKLNSMRRQRSQLKGLAERLAANDESGDIVDQATALRDRILEIEKGIFIPELREGWAGRLNQGTDPLRRLSALPSVVGLGEFPPTEQSYAVYDKLAGQIQGRLDAFDALGQGDIAAFNQLIKDRGIALIG